MVHQEISGFHFVTHRNQVYMREVDILKIQFQYGDNLKRLDSLLSNPRLDSAKPLEQVLERSFGTAIEYNHSPYYPVPLQLELDEILLEHQHRVYMNSELVAAYQLCDWTCGEIACAEVSAHVDPLRVFFDDDYQAWIQVEKELTQPLEKVLFTT